MEIMDNIQPGTPQKFPKPRHRPQTFVLKANDCSAVLQQSIFHLLNGLINVFILLT